MRDYISPAIVNEIINISGNTILRQLLQEIQAADWFSLIADEATDVSHNEQMCIAVRWVDSSYTIHEAALGLVQLPDTKALTLFGIIKDVLSRCSLPITDCVGQAYDGGIKYERCMKWCSGPHEERVRSLSLCTLLCPQFKSMCSRGDKEM